MHLLTCSWEQTFRDATRLASHTGMYVLSSMLTGALWTTAMAQTLACKTVYLQTVRGTGEFPEQQQRIGCLTNSDSHWLHTLQV